MKGGIKRRRYVLFVNQSRSEEFEIILKNTYVKYFVKRKLIPSDYIYILTIGDTLIDSANFYMDIKAAKEAGIVYFVGAEMLEKEEE